jgi:hypothetical protein
MGSVIEELNVPSNDNIIKVGSNFKGLIDNLSLYERAISDEEFRQLGDIKRYEGQLFKHTPIINCHFNDVIKINKNFEAKYFMFEYISNYGNVLYEFNEVDFYENETSTFSTNVRNDNNAKFIELTLVSNIQKIICNNSIGDKAVKQIDLYYTNSIDGFNFNTITIAQFKELSSFGQRFHLQKGAASQNIISENIAIDNSGKGNHGLFAHSPIKNNTNHYGGTYNKSVEIGGMSNNSIVFDGFCYSNMDFSESYMSSWIKASNTLTEQVDIFHKKDNFKFSLTTNNFLQAEFFNTKTSLSNILTSQFSIDDEVWTNVGIHFNKQNNKATFYKKTNDITIPSSIDTHSNIDLSFNNTITSDIVTRVQGGGGAYKCLLVDNLRIDLGFFNGINTFEEIADFHNKIAINTITNNIWTHVAATYDQSKAKIKMYHDGAKVAEYNNYNVAPTSAGTIPVHIGKYENNFMSDNIQIADIKVFDETYNEQQINQLFLNQ